MKFYDNRIIKLEIIESDFAGLADMLYEKFYVGVKIQSITPEQEEEFDKIAMKKELSDSDFDYICKARGKSFEENCPRPFVLFCADWTSGTRFIIGNHVKTTGKETQVQFALIPKNFEKGIKHSQMEYIKGYTHHNDFYDSVKYSGGTIFTTETLSTFMNQALPYFEKFYIAAKPLYGYTDQTPEKEYEQELYMKKNFKSYANVPFRREEISSDEMKALIEAESEVGAKTL